MKLSKWPQNEFNGLVDLNQGILVVVEFLFPIILLSGDFPA